MKCKKLDAGGKPSNWFPPEGLVELAIRATCIKYDIINLSHLNYELQSAHNQSYVDDSLRDLAKLMLLDELFRNLKSLLRSDITRLRIIGITFIKCDIMQFITFEL